MRFQSLSSRPPEISVTATQGLERLPNNLGSVSKLRIGNFGFPIVSREHAMSWIANSKKELDRQLNLTWKVCVPLRDCSFNDRPKVGILRIVVELLQRKIERVQ